MKKFWEFYRKNHRLQDSTKNFVKKQNILEYDFLVDWIKKKEHQEVFGSKIINENFRFKNIVEQLLVPNFIKRKKGFAVLGKIIRIVGTIKLKRLKVHVNPFLQVFPSLKLHSHITMELKGVGQYSPSQLNLYRPYSLSNILPFNLKWHMSKASFALLYFKNISKKANWNQSAQIKYMFLRTALQRMAKLKEKSKSENKLYIFENIKKDFKTTEILSLYLRLNIKKVFQKTKKLMNGCSFFLENLNLIVVKPLFLFNNYLSKIRVAPSRKKRKLKKKKKKIELTEIEIQKKLDLNKLDVTEIEYVHPARMSTRANWRRLKQTITFGFITNVGWKTRFDNVYEDKVLFKEAFRNSNLNLYFNPWKKMERKTWINYAKAFFDYWKTKLQNWSSSDKKIKKRLWTKSFLKFSLHVKRLWLKKRSFRLFESPYAYMRTLRWLNKRNLLNKFLQTKWNPKNVDHRFYKLIDFIYERKLKGHETWDYKWKLKKLGSVSQLKINNKLNINNKKIEKFNKLLKNKEQLKDFSKYKDIKTFFLIYSKRLPSIIKRKFFKFFNLAPHFTLRPNRVSKRLRRFRYYKKSWFKYFKRFKKVRFKVRNRYHYLLKKFKNKNQLMEKSFINEKTKINQSKFKKLSNLYAYINPNVDSLFINNSNIKDYNKDLFIQQHIGLNNYKKAYGKLLKWYLRKWTAKHQMNNMALWLIAFYKLLNEFFTVICLCFYKGKTSMETINSESYHKRSSNSYRSKYQLRNWYPFLQENIDFIKFDKKLPLVKDTTKYFFIDNLENKDSIYKYLFYKMFFTLMNLDKIRNVWLFDPFRKFCVLMIIKFFRKILLIDTAFGIYKDFETLFLKKEVNEKESSLTTEENLDVLFSLANLRLFYELIYNNKVESKSRIWPINMPGTRAETLYVKSLFSFINWKFLHLYKLRQLISSFRFKQKVCDLPVVSAVTTGYRNKQIRIANWLRYRKLEVSGYKKFSVSRAYKNRLVYSNLVFYDISHKALSDKTYLHNSHVFYNGYGALSKKTFFK